jgi:hypothetical protein
MGPLNDFDSSGPGQVPGLTPSPTPPRSGAEDG